MARRRKYIDRKLMKDLALAQLSNDEIARMLRVSPDTVARRYASAIKEWRRIGVGSVRRELFSMALGTEKGGKVAAMIFFLKNYGGMADVVKTEMGTDFASLPRTEFQSQTEPRATDRPQ